MELSWNDFEKIDLRVGTILTAEDAIGTRKPAYRLTIDFGKEIGIKKSSAQLTQLYSRDQLTGMQVIAVVNFPPKHIGTFMSECLVLGSIGADGAVTLLTTERGVVNGSRIA